MRSALQEFLHAISPSNRWLATLVIVALVVALSIAPGTARPGDTVFSWLVANTATPVQKAAHLVIYALLAGLWFWTLESVNSTAARLVLALVLSIALGATLEWLQTSIPGRYGSLGDVLLNAIGALIGLVVAFFVL